MSTSVPPTPRGVTRVVVEKPRINVKDYLWTGTLGLFTFVGQATLVGLHHLLPARLGQHLPAQDGQARRPAPEPEEDHGAGARRGPRADAALPVRADGDQRRRRRRSPAWRSTPSASTTRLVWGIARRHHQPRSLPRRGGDRRRLGGRSASSSSKRSTAALYIGAASFAIHTARRQPADAVVDGSGQPDERRSRSSSACSLFGWLWGVVGPAARHADPDGRQVGLRPGRGAEAGRRAARRLSAAERFRQRRRRGRGAGLRQAPDEQRRARRRRRPAPPRAAQAAGALAATARSAARATSGASANAPSRGLAEALALAGRAAAPAVVERQRAGRRVAPSRRAAEAAAGRCEANTSDARRACTTSRVWRRVERRRALVGNDAQEARRRRQRPAPATSADLAVALEPVEDAAAELAPGIVGARAALQANRRDARAGGEAQLDVDRAAARRRDRSGASRAARGCLAGGRRRSARTTSSSARVDGDAARRVGDRGRAGERRRRSPGRAQTRRTKRPAASGRPTTGCVSAPLRRLQRHHLAAPARAPAAQVVAGLDRVGGRELGRAGPAQAAGAAAPGRPRRRSPRSISQPRRFARRVAAAALPAAERRTLIRSPSTTTSTGDGQAALPAGRARQRIEHRLAHAARSAHGRGRRREQREGHALAGARRRRAGRAGRAAPRGHRPPAAAPARRTGPAARSRSARA